MKNPQLLADEISERTMQIITAIQKAKSDIKAAEEELEELEYSWPEELLAQSFLNNTPNDIAVLRKNVIP